MTTTKELRVYAQEQIEKFPNLKKDIVGLFNLCVNEIDEGGSVEHEVQLCHSEIEQLIK